MKKILPLLFVLILTQTKAQYHPMLGDTTKWCLHWNFIPVRESRILEYNRFDAMGDTVLMAQSYKTVFTDWSGYFGAVREDSANKKVYFLHPDSTTEELLYDFNLVLNDSIYLNFHNNSMGNFNDGYYKVDSVNLINIRGGLRKYIRLHNPANTNTGPNGGIAKIEWIESVGEIHNTFYPYMYDSHGFGTGTMNCGSETESEVFNNEIDGERNYVNLCIAANPGGYLHPDTCQIDYAGSVNELAGQNLQLNVYPNPSNGKNFTVSIPSTKTYRGDMQLSITDLNGRNVFATMVKVPGNMVAIDGLNLHNGMYVVTLHSQRTLIGRGKLTVE